eukprot:COSAG05_NODE_17120_length_331_cov_1.116379_1_plen_20_part_10
MTIMDVVNIQMSDPNGLKYN